MNAPMRIPINFRRGSAKTPQTEAYQTKGDYGGHGDSRYPPEVTSSSATRGSSGQYGEGRQQENRGRFPSTNPYATAKQYGVLTQYSTEGIGTKGHFDFNGDYTSVNQFGGGVRQGPETQTGRYKTLGVYTPEPQLSPTELYDSKMAATEAAAGYGSGRGSAHSTTDNLFGFDSRRSGNYGVAPGRYSNTRNPLRAKMTYLGQQNGAMQVASGPFTFSRESPGNHLHENSKHPFGYEGNSGYRNSERYGNTNPYGSSSGGRSPFDSVHYDPYSSTGSVQFDTPLNDYDYGASSSSELMDHDDYKNIQTRDEVPHRRSNYYRPYPKYYSRSTRNQQTSDQQRYYPRRERSQYRRNYNRHLNYDNEGYSRNDEVQGRVSPRGQYYQDKYESRRYKERPRTYTNERGYTPRYYDRYERPYSRTSPNYREHSRRSRGGNSYSRRYRRPQERTFSPWESYHRDGAYHSNGHLNHDRPEPYTYSSQANSGPGPGPKQYEYSTKRYRPAYGYDSKRTLASHDGHESSEYVDVQNQPDESIYYETDLSPNSVEGRETTSYVTPIEGTDYAIPRRSEYPENKHTTKETEDVGLQNDFSVSEPAVANLAQRPVREAMDGHSRSLRNHRNMRHFQQKPSQNAAPVLDFNRFVKGELESLVLAELPDARFR